MHLEISVCSLKNADKCRACSRAVVHSMALRCLQETQRVCEEAGRQTLLIPGDISEDAQCQCVNAHSACLAAPALQATFLHCGAVCAEDDGVCECVHV